LLNGVSETLLSVSQSIRKSEAWLEGDTALGRGKSARSLELIDTAYDILAEIQPATVRAVCYRLFVAGKLVAMTKNETNRVSKQLVYAREEGIIPWEWVVDETRQVERKASWADPAAYVRAVSRSYRRDRWRQQDYHVEVWSEKGTVRGTLAPVLDQYGVPFRVMHGYGSATTLHDVAEDSDGENFVALYCGDWDPSGLHMSKEDLPTRVEEYDGAIEMIRVALTAQDVANSALPGFHVDTKRADSRYKWFRSRFGTRCVELDALSPVELRRRVEVTIQDYIDWEEWQRCEQAEAAERESMQHILDNWQTAAG
jgi:hypothetical protein